MSDPDDRTEPTDLDTDGSPTEQSQQAPTESDASECSPEESTPASPTTEDMFTVLSHAKRRVVIATLAERGRSTPVDELVDAVIESTDADGSMDEVRVSLRHVHLPKIDEVGIATYDSGAGVVEPHFGPSTFAGVQDVAQEVR